MWFLSGRSSLYLKIAKVVVIFDHSPYMITISSQTGPLRCLSIFNIHYPINMLNQIGLHVSTLARSLDMFEWNAWHSSRQKEKLRTAKCQNYYETVNFRLFR
jgi:hypothetical protein